MSGTISAKAHVVDPAVARVLTQIPPLELSLARLQYVRDQAPPSSPQDPQVERLEFPLDADTGVTMRVHRPRDDAGPRACIFVLHSGGYVLGSNHTNDARLDRWARAFNIVAVSVDYRLAPETQYPGPLDDCCQGLEWILDNACELGIDPARVGVVGASAGGGLAAALMLRVRDRPHCRLLFVGLEAPMLDDRQVTPSSRTASLPVWSREDNLFGWRSYLGSLHGTDDIPQYAAPSRALDLSELPPTFISVGSCDGFRDEDIDFALRLSQAGVPTELHVYPGATHGFSLIADTPVGRQSVRDIESWIARQLA